MVFGEGQLPAAVPGRNRLGLAPAKTLVYWTTPSSPAEVRATLAAVRPERAILFGVDPGLDRPDAFLQRLTGLVKYVAQRTRRASDSGRTGRRYGAP